ncbi:dTMP kinase [candidate division WOR-3 bacterium]|nr:dTMP kinase [candidate division WOR-3 bacterium]
MKKKERNRKGIFITFEGVEGSGKSVQSKLLYDSLKEGGFKVYLTREPGGTDTGEKIREILLNTQNNISPYTELFLYLANRSQHIVEVIKPRLSSGEIIISDRFFDSTIAYQHAGRRISRKEIDAMKDLEIFNNLEPDLTFLLDTDPGLTKSRVGIPDRIEKEDLEFHSTIRNAYLSLAKEAPERITLINANETIENIHRKIIKRTLSFIEEVPYE